MKSTNLEVKAANLVAGMSARLGQTIFAAIAALCLTFSITSTPASAQQAKASSPFSPASTTAMCGEDFTLLNTSGALTVNLFPDEDDGEPGLTDPMAVPAGRYDMFADDEVLAFSPRAAMVRASVLTTDRGGTVLTPHEYGILSWDPDGWGPPAYFPAAGRFLKPQSDDALWAARRGDPNIPNGAADITFFYIQSNDRHRTFSAILPGTLLQRQTNFTDFMAIASGDLDNVVGSDGNYHDDVVVAKAASQDASNYNYDLDVVNYSSGQIANPAISAASFSTSKPTLLNFPTKNEDGLLPSGDSIVSVTTGDFKGDGNKEIAALALTNGTLELRTFQYATTGSTHQLTQIAAGTASFDLFNDYPSGDKFWRGKPIVGTLSVTSGDFDGDGADEIAVAYAKWDYTNDTSSTNPYEIGMLILKYDSTFKATVKSDGVVAATDRLGTKTFENRPSVQIVSGQFLFNPPSIRYGRKQIVVGWRGLVEDSANVHMRAYSLSTNLAISPMGGNYPYPGKAQFVKFSIAAGGFEGASAEGKPEGNPPVSQLTLSYWYGGNAVASPTYTVLNTYKVSNDGISLWQKSTTNDQATGVGPDDRMRVPVIAYDGHGNSLYIGAPIHMSTSAYPTIDYVMQEPPKHAYWDENKHTIENVTRFDGNNVHLSHGTTASFATTTKSETSRDTGGSIAASASTTITAGSDFGIVKAKAEVQTDVTLKGSYDYNEKKEWTDEQYHELELTSAGQTDREDFLKGKSQSFDIWRYRVYGTPRDGNTNAFFEFVLPGPYRVFEGGASGYAWYQPIHENGNILSYPQRLGSDSTKPNYPADMGKYTLPGSETGYFEPLVPPTSRSFDGTSGSVSLNFNSDIARTQAFSFSHSIGESAEVRVSATGEVKLPGGGTDNSICGSFEFHNNNSWGGNNSATSNTKEQTEVQLNLSTGSYSQAYPFNTVVYNTKEGAIKAAFSLPNPASRSSNPGGYGYYAGLYGSSADPALNLPYRFIPQSAGSGELEQWAPNQLPNRKKMRGLFFRHSTKDAAAGTYLLWSANPKPGDTVRIEPRIYNYSTGTEATNITVTFQVIQYESTSDNELCTSPINDPVVGQTGNLVCPRSVRRTIGSARIPSLKPLQFTCVDGYDDPAVTDCAPPVYLNWTIPAEYAPDNGTYQYRVYVVLSTDQQEKYGLEANPIDITAVENNTPMVVTVPNSNLHTGEYVVIGGVRGLPRANGTWVVTHVSNNQFALDGSVLSPGSYTGGGTVANLDPGQNDEGYGGIDITRVPAVTAADDPVPHDYLDANSLQAPAGDGSTQGQESGITAVQGVPLQLRFTAYSTMVHADSAQVMLFDGDPGEGNPAIGDQFIHPGENGPDGASIWITWTPTTVGQHHLYAALIEGSGRTAPAGELDVNVIPSQPASAAQGGEPTN